MGSVEVTTPKDIAKAFNDHFATIGLKLQSTLGDSSPNIGKSFLANILQISHQQMPKLPTVSPKYVASIISRLLSSTSAGTDGISARILKMGAPVLSIPLSEPINKSSSTGIFPDNLNMP